MSYRNRSTIRSVIEEGLELKMTIKDLCFKEVMTNSSGVMFIINMYNLYEKYYELLLEQSTVVVLSDEEYAIISDNSNSWIKLNFKLLELFGKTDLIASNK